MYYTNNNYTTLYLYTYRLRGDITQLKYLHNRKHRIIHTLGVGKSKLIQIKTLVGAQLRPML